MKFTIQIKDVSEALKKCSAAQTGRSTLPILSCIKLDADADGLRLTATDLDRWISCKVPAQVTKPGSVALSYRLLAGILTGSGSATFDVSDKHKAIICAGSSTYRISGLAGDELPALPDLRKTKTFTIPSEEWLRGSLAVKWAASADPGRMALCGTLMECRDSKVSLVATGGNQLSKTELAVDVDFNAEAIIPTSSMTLIDAIATDDGPLAFCIDDSTLAVENGSDIIITKLIEMNYPNFRQVIPDLREMKTTCTLHAKPFLDSLDRVAIVGTSTSPSAKLDMRDGTISVTMKADDEATAIQPAEITGEPLLIALNPRLLRNPFRSWDAESLTLQFIDAMSPIVIVNDRNTYVLMPMRVTN